MSIDKWSPLKELEDMRRDMDRLFDEFAKPVRRRRIWPKSEGLVIPNMDLYDRKNDIVVKVELPGVRREDIDLTITKDTLIVKGEVKKDEDAKEEDYFIAERTYGNFTRTVTLPFEVENEKAQASINNGILEIVMPKREEARPKEIRIEVK
ncbi:MAG TPA: Hsp20/alpha crystallin family protein [Dissulfurispiraceae bacterium]|nr:Hsp20/alpha crystallin family protein [Dissulfurispiraceae bacterium]